MTVIGWKLDRAEREQLLQRFPPRYPTAVADHVTLETTAQSSPLPPAVTAAIVGHTDDGAGIEAMVVTIEGTTDRRDGSTFHITWSLGEGREATESNDVIAARGWTEFALPMPVTVTPARWP